MKRVVFCLIVALLLFCGAFAPQNSIAQSSKQLKLYTKALQRFLIYRDTTSAHILANQALAIDSNYIAANHLLSRIEKEPARALRAIERAIAADSSDHHLLEQAVEVSLQAKQYLRSKELLSRLVKDSQEPDHFRLLTILYNLNKEHDNALSVLDSADVRFGKIDLFRRMRQQLYLERGDIEKALNCATELVESAPYDPANHISLAEIYATIKADSLAEKAYHTALNIEKKDPSLWSSYAGFLDSRQRYSEMLMVWRQLFELEDVPLENKLSLINNVTSKREFYRKYFLHIGQLITRLYQLYPLNPQVVNIYISHLISANRVNEAVALLKGRIKETVPTADELKQIVDIELYLARTDSVEVYVDRGIKLYPADENFWGIKAWLQTKRKDYLGAIATLKQALKFAENNDSRSTLWGNIGDQYYNMEEMKKSYAAYNKALSYNFDNAMVLNNYAYHLSVTEKSLDTALTMAKRATELSPNNATYLDTLAWVYFKRGELEEAKKYMQQAMSFDKDNSSELALHYGDILDALGSTFMAQTYWRKALERGAPAEEIERRIEAQKMRLNSKKME